MEESKTYIAPYNHCTAGFNLFNRLTKWNPVKMPMSWNPTTRSFDPTDVRSREYLPWYFCVWVVICFIVISSSLDAIFNTRTVGLALCITSFGWIGFSYLVWGIGRILCQHWTSIVRGFECYNQLTELFDKLYPSSAKEFESDKKWTMISELLKGIIATFCGIPFILTPGTLLQDMDPFIYTFPKLFCENPAKCPDHIIWSIHVSRWILGYIAIFEACRFYAVFFPTLLFIFERQMHCLYVLGNMPPKSDHLYTLEYFRWYAALRVADRTNNDGICGIAGVTMGAGFTVWVGVNVITLKCYNILPIAVYWLMPTVSVIILVLSGVLLSTVVKSRVESEAQLFSVKLLLASGHKTRPEINIKRKIILKRLRSCRPLIVKCGQFFPLREEIKITFFYDVFMRTIDGSMMPFFEQINTVSKSLYER